VDTPALGAVVSAKARRMPKMMRKPQMSARIDAEYLFTLVLQGLGGNGPRNNAVEDVERWPAWHYVQPLLKKALKKVKVILCLPARSWGRGQ
jgi:hypothetical protein